MADWSADLSAVLRLAEEPNACRRLWLDHVGGVRPMQRAGCGLGGLDHDRLGDEGRQAAAHRLHR